MLSRDKNWVRWKIENCPAIIKPPISPEDYITSKVSAKKATANKRLRPTPMGSLDLKFLTNTDDKSGLDRLKDPSRYTLPSFRTFQEKIEEDEMDIEMAKANEEKNQLIDGKASKTWRTLRLASTTMFTRLEKVTKAEEIKEIFKDDIKAEDVRDDSLDHAEDAILPKDLRAIIISGPACVGKSTLVTKLIDKHPDVFVKKVPYTTRPSRQGEVEGVDYFFISKEQYNTLRDNDEFLEMNDDEEYHYGTRRKTLDGFVAKSKVPLVELDHNVRT